MAHTSVFGGYPNFNDQGRPTGSDISSHIPDEDARLLELAHEETTVPLPVEVEGELFDRSVGVVEQSGQIARKATQICLYEITQAPERFYDGTLSLEHIMSSVRHFAGLTVDRNKEVLYSQPECRKSCILATLGRCPLAMEGFDISEEAFAELVGIQIKSKRPPKKTLPQGVLAFQFFSKSSFSVRAPGLPKDLEDAIMETSAVNHIVSWWVKHRPKPESKDTPVKANPTEQLKFDI